MTYTTLIEPAALHALLLGPQPPLVFDCSFDLGDGEAGRRAYEAGHIPGASYLHLDEHMSGAKTGTNGRHPLPDKAAFAQLIASRGADDDTQIVAYDAQGAMFAARLWWMLRWVGHRAAAVLDGGVCAWRAQALPLSAQPAPARRAGNFSVRPALAEIVDGAFVDANLSSRERLLIDARSAERFRGENETLDPIGGHIPGARNRPFRDNLAADGSFKSAAQLKSEFDAIAGGRSARDLVSQCGSGVTACHNILALEVAGMPGAALYPGSWSEWCARPGAPIAKGAA